MTADSSHGSQELRNMQLLEERSQGNPCSKYIVQLLDFFVHRGPNGQHQCLVFELLGPTLNMVLLYYNMDDDVEENLTTKTIFRLSEQLLEAIELIHDTGMGHGGNGNSIYYFHFS
jgi:serine/threonine-protein kinase SRPK3